MRAVVPPMGAENMKRSALPAIVVCAVLTICLTSYKTWGEDIAPASDPKAAAAEAKAKATAAVKTAIEALIKDFKANKLLTKCSYFSDNKPADITDEAILAALDSSVSSNGRESAYIKWQLLSGLPPKVDEKLTSRLARLLTSAPGLIPNPGLDTQTKNQVAGEIGRLQSKDDINTFNTNWLKKVHDTLAPNEVILNYRDDLFMRLPASADSIMAGLKDGCGRANAGIDASGIMGLATSAARNWGASGAKPNEIGQVVGTLNTIIKMMPGALTMYDDPGQPLGQSAVALLEVYTQNPLILQTGAAAGATPAKPAATKPAAPTEPAIVPNCDGTPVSNPATQTFPPAYVAGAGWVPTSPKRGDIRYECAKFPKKTDLNELVKYLTDCVKNPGGGLKFSTPG